jgi:formylglycine-generating enzyme required for sulfatase activity
MRAHGDGAAVLSEPRTHDRWAVPLATVALVGASWAALELASSPASPDAEAAERATSVELPGEVPGFRAAAWYLPEEELLGFVEISAGPFIMGSDPAEDPLAFDVERWSPAAPRGTVDVPAYFIARYEVTVAQYAAFVRATGHRVADENALRGGPAFPVVSVAWTDALAYARWLHETLAAWSGTPEPIARRLREGWKVTLPTEAQWEKAARGADGRIFPWGSEPKAERANYQGPGPTRVGAFDCPECPYGLADMSGNVWEWTRSPYQPYPYAESDDTAGLDVEALWVMRGGSFNDVPRNLRAAVRGGADPGARRPFIGFRIVISPP